MPWKNIKKIQGLVINGRAIPVQVPCTSFVDTGLVFTGKPWKKPPDLCVLHWTAAENPPEQVYRTLKARRLSVHFTIAKDGTIYQFCDPALVRCAHAGRANDRAVGIEVVNYGWKHPRKKSPEPDRRTYRVTIHGWRTTVADYLPAQYKALLEIARVLHTEMRIPLETPAHNRRLSADELKNFSGFCGHYHVDRLNKKHPKIDPGTAPLGAIRCAGLGL